MRVYRKRAKGGRDVADDHPLFDLLCRSPNAEMTPGRFMLMIVASIVIRGNAYVEKRRIGNRVVSLEPLLPQNVTVRRENGRLVYDVLDGVGGKRTLKADDVMHIRGFGIDGICGAQPISHGREVIGAATAANEASAKIFAQGMQASGVLSTDATLSPVQREQFGTNLTKYTQSTAVGKLMLLENGMTYQGIAMNPEDAQMLETRGFNVEEICRWFGVPPFMVGHMDKASSWASSVEAQNLHFLTSCLRPILDNIEQEIIRCLIPRAEWGIVYAEFSVEGLLRADSAGRAAYYNILLQNGVYNRNEVRAKENEPPIPGGDIYTVQVNLTPLHMLGTQPQQADAARAALKAWLDALPSAELAPA
jgi:HK97 family phage portal protein